MLEWLQCGCQGFWVVTRVLMLRWLPNKKSIYLGYLLKIFNVTVQKINITRTFSFSLKY